MASAQIKVEIDQVETVEGGMFIAVYASEEGFLEVENAVRKEIIPVDRLDFTHTFSNLPAGEYAVAIFHDVNGNGKMDKNFLGIPKEPYGFSNNVVVRFGPPNFKDTRFEVKAGKETVTRISLKRF